MAQFGQTGATQAIFNLYQQTRNGELIYALEALQAAEGAPIVQARGFYAESNSMIHYGKAEVRQFLPQITATFQSSKKPDVKVAAAWALATMTGDLDATAFLLQVAQSAVHAPTRDIDSREVIKDLGCIQDPRVKPVLEAALSSTDPEVVQTAIVNLIYNQGGSDKAVQVIANQLNDSTHARLPWDFVLNMATQLIDNPEIRAAGEKFSQHDATGDWELYTVERKNWPIANWVGGYVVMLNKSARR